MSNCQTCGKTFGFFTKELGCPKCNKVFCKKCLIHKIPASDNPKKTILVCLRCSKIDEIPIKQQKKPVEELLQIQPEEIEAPILEPNTQIRNRLDELKNVDENEEEMSTEDQNIDDIQKRLANLKGIDYDKNKTVDKIIFSTDTRTEQEKIDDLLKQFVEEKEINQQFEDQQQSYEPKTGTIEDIEKRLAMLRGVDVSKIKSQVPDYVDETKQEEIDRTILQYLDEAKLPDLDYEQEFLDSIPVNKDAKKEDLEELPFCEICNEDAVIRCLECENIFCHACFMQFHDEEDYKTHKTKPYEAPARKSDD